MSRDMTKTPLLKGLATLPVFFDLAGKRAVLAGASPRAVWKAELLQATGAEVAVLAAAPCEEMQRLAAQAAGVTLLPRAWCAADLVGAAIAIGDMETPADAAAFQDAARRAGVPVNCIDQPAFCDFQFGAIVERSPLVIGISTHGAAPVFGQALRGWLDALLPQAMRDWAGAAKAWRPRLQALNLSYPARRAFWERFARKALTPSQPAPTEADLEVLLAEAEALELRPHVGAVTLVGAGPGDPDLVTLKAVRALHAADVVLFDDLVSPRIVEMARREAVKVAVGKRGYRPSCRQDDITASLIEWARAGKRVVRLKGGDPMIFGRANEEITALKAAGIPVEVVPGITAALGAAAALQVSLTERDLSRRVQFITAHARDGRLPTDIDWHALCDPRAATIVYMGVKTMGPLTDALLAHGLDPATPAVLVERATWAQERRIRGTIADLGTKVAADPPDGPCLVMIGAVFAAVDGAPAEVARAVAEAPH